MHIWIHESHINIQQVAAGLYGGKEKNQEIRGLVPFLLPSLFSRSFFENIHEQINHLLEIGKVKCFTRRMGI